MTLKSDPKKSQFLRNLHFLYDAIDLKQPLEGTLKVQGKSLTTVLDEVHFIVNLYSFLLPLVLQANPFLPKVSHMPPLPGRAASKTPPLFLRISELPGQNQQNDKQSSLSPLSFNTSLKDTFFQGFISPSRMLVEFSLKLLYSTMCGKIFKVMEFTFLENALIRSIFTHAPPHSKLAPKFLPSRPRQKEITHSPQAAFFRKSVSHNSRKVQRKL